MLPEQLEAVLGQAYSELRDEEFREAVEAAKVRIRARRAFWRYIRATPRRIWEYLIYV